MHLSSLADAPNLVKLLYRGSNGKEVGFSFNVSDRCPINCDCYWRPRARVDEMSDEDAVAFFHEMKDRGYLLVNLVGGEPYVRPELLEKLTPIMPANWITTSGTTPLRHFPRTTHFVSIDGWDAETHNRIRKSKGLFERIVKNLTKARAEGGFPAYGHMVLNSQNFWQVREVMEFWSRNELLDGFLFSLHTPIRGGGDDHLRMTEDQRFSAVAGLRRAKLFAGDYMLNTNRMLDLMHPDVARHQTPETCGTARLVASFDAAGNRIEQCILGGQADCSQCGCVITGMMETMFPRPRYSSIKMLAQLRA